jgi:hypothetical protein
MLGEVITVISWIIFFVATKSAEIPIIIAKLNLLNSASPIKLITKV